MSEADYADKLYSALCTACGPGRVGREVVGVVEHTPRWKALKTTVRLDLIFYYCGRYIGIECKDPDAEDARRLVGKGISQAMDYMNFYRFSNRVGDAITLDCIAVAPLKPESGAMASIQAQNRVGWCNFGAVKQGHAWQIGCGHVAVIRFTACNQVAWINPTFNFGKKVGSR